jgi:uncharacterized BrkB/YihY/UPF0761 family membrane protein
MSQPWPRDSNETASDQPGAVQVAVSMIFTWYVAEFNSYNRIYGSLGAVVGFMTWIWLSVVIVLIGAELDAAIDKRTSMGSARRVVPHRTI